MGGDNVDMVLRRARYDDRGKVIEVESKATPNLSYVHSVWDMLVSDEVGEFSALI